MIVIFSTQEDRSTHLVVEWLKYYGQNPILINEINPITDIKVNLVDRGEDFIIRTKGGQKIKSDEIKIVWYRRGLYFMQFQYTNLRKKTEFLDLYDHLKSEYSSLTQLLFEILQKKTIGEFNMASPNKQILLMKAKNTGMKTPDTVICSSKKYSFKSQHINKNITEILNYRTGKSWFYNRTTIQKNYPVNNFFPSLFQELIEKKYELRIFFFLDLFYSMITLPAGTGKLKVDIREITQKDNLQRFPFRLPKLFESKLKTFIKSTGYTTGSIDILIDEKNDFYFLELNPVGQFNYVSAVCNYNIEKAIAIKLCEYEKKGFNK
jgi:hypothetical protein